MVIRDVASASYIQGTTGRACYIIDMCHTRVLQWFCCNTNWTWCKETKCEQLLYDMTSTLIFHVGVGPPRTGYVAVPDERKSGQKLQGQTASTSGLLLLPDAIYL